MTRLTGTATMLRFYLRRDRIRLPIWIASIGVLIVVTAISLHDTYPTQEDLESRAQFIEGNPAMIALTGPAHGVDDPTLGATIANEVGLYGMAAAAAMSIFLVVRHTRAEEESERAELIRSGVVGRDASLAAALCLAALANLAVAAVTVLSMFTVDVPVAGSVLFGASFAAVGLSFAGLAAVAAQVTSYARGANGIGIAALGLAFALRAVGDIRSGALSWFSPLGWGQATEVWVNDRWWPLGLALGAGVAWAAIAFVISARRDLGAGLLQQRPGPPRAARGLAHPLGLALRLQRAVLVSWIVGMALFAAIYGTVGDDIETFLEDNPDMAEIFAMSGASLTDSFLASIAVLLALCVGGYGIQVVQRMRTEETSGRAEPLLAAPLSRLRWGGATIVLSVVGTVLVLVATGLGLGLTYAIAVGDLSRVGSITGAIVAYLPALGVLVGFAFALVGLAPRLTGAAWAALALPFVVWMGALFGFPDWVQQLSPFHYVPAMPADAFAPIPLVVLSAIAVGLFGAGLLGLRRRDIAST